MWKLNNKRALTFHQTHCLWKSVCLHYVQGGGWFHGAALQGDNLWRSEASLWWKEESVHSQPTACGTHGGEMETNLQTNKMHNSQKKRKLNGNQYHCNDWCLNGCSSIMSSQVDLDVTLPGEGGKDRPFKVSIKFVSLVSWHMLHEVLTGRSMPEPLELDKPISTNPVHAVDVVLRHLPSMKWATVLFFPS